MRMLFLTPLRIALVTAAVLLLIQASAFPPTPHHLVYGTVRDEWGNPLNEPGAMVILEADGRVMATAQVALRHESSVNYRLAIPMDSGATPRLYKPTALRPTVPFRLRVRIGELVYLPIQMTGAEDLLTQAGQRSRVDLTLGADTDGDGIPDAWELEMLRLLGQSLSIADVRPEDDLDNDGMSNLDEYIAGTYAYDPADGFSLSIVTATRERLLLEFTAVRGRNYTLHGSHDMSEWHSLPFTLTSDPPNSSARTRYQADQTRRVQAWVNAAAITTGDYRFFKVSVR